MKPTKSSTCSFQLSLLLFKQGETWVAQCLQFDIAEYGDTIDLALESFKRAFVGHIAGDLEEDRSPLEGLEQAPSKFWDLFETAQPLLRTMPMRMPSISPRDTRTRSLSGLTASASELRVY